jgi:DNA helicase-2/ATP-dependent DNA helicase PcrA
LILSKISDGGKLNTIRNAITNDYEKIKFEIIIDAIDKIGSKNKPRFDKSLNILREYALDNFKTVEEENEKENVLNDITAWSNLWNSYLLKSNSDNRNLLHFRTMVALGELQEIATNIEGITLSTVHSAKGLQFDIVFLVGMTEGVFPDYRSLNNQNELNEERNNAFVALTRAKRLLYITYPKEKMMPWEKTKKQIISRFVKNMENE